LLLVLLVDSLVDLRGLWGCTAQSRIKSSNAFDGVKSCSDKRGGSDKCGSDECGSGKCGSEESGKRKCGV
jgi:hypothetical protein